MFPASSRALMDSPEVFSSLALLIVAYALPLVFAKRDKKVHNSPVSGQPGDPSFEGALAKGYKQFKDSTFTIPTAHHSIVIIPPKFFDEIKALPEHTLKFKEQVSERFLDKYRGLGITDTLVHSVKIDLTKNIPSILNDRQDEVGYAAAKDIGDVPGMDAIPDPWVQWNGLIYWNRLDPASVVPHVEQFGRFTIKSNTCGVSSQS